MTKVGAKLVPKNLTCNQKLTSVSICEDWLENWDNFDKVITGDESWMYLSCERIRLLTDFRGEKLPETQAKSRKGCSAVQTSTPGLKKVEEKERLCQKKELKKVNGPKRALGFSKKVMNKKVCPRHRKNLSGSDEQEWADMEHQLQRVNGTKRVLQKVSKQKTRHKRCRKEHSSDFEHTDEWNDMDTNAHLLTIPVPTRKKLERLTEKQVSLVNLLA